MTMFYSIHSVKAMCITIAEWRKSKCPIPTNYDAATDYYDYDSPNANQKHINMSYCDMQNRVTCFVLYCRVSYSVSYPNIQRYLTR